MTTETRNFNAASFYAHLKEGQFMGVRCQACGKLSAEARPMCQDCHGRAMEWFAFCGRGQLSAFTCISVVPNAMGEKGYGRKQSLLLWHRKPWKRGPPHQRSYSGRGRRQPAEHHYRHGIVLKHPGHGLRPAGLGLWSGLAASMRFLLWAYGKARRKRNRATALVIKDGKLLVVRERGARHWSLPGGGMKKGEEPVEAACRELVEENRVDGPVRHVHLPLRKRQPTPPRLPADGGR